MNDRVVMGVHSRRCARCLVPSPVLGEGRGECRPKTRIVASLDMESGAALRASRISAFLSIKYWSTGAIFEYLSDCAAAFGTRKPMLIASLGHDTDHSFPRGRPHREISFRRRRSLSFIISFKSTTGRISIGPSPYLKPGCCETS